MSVQICSGCARFMPTADKSSRIIELEREILRQFCNPGATAALAAQTEAEARERLMRELLAYAWQDAEHRVVFEALLRLPGRDAAELQRQLPAKATRMGFPDVRWEEYFDAGTTSDDNSAREQASVNIAALIARLQAAPREATS